MAILLIFAETRNAVDLLDDIRLIDGSFSVSLCIKPGINTVKNKRQPRDTFKLSCVTTTCASMCVTLQHHHMPLPSGNQQGRMIDDHLFVYLFSLECSLKWISYRYLSFVSDAAVCFDPEKEKSPIIIDLLCFALYHRRVSNLF